MQGLNAITIKPSAALFRPVPPWPWPTALGGVLCVVLAALVSSSRATPASAPQPLPAKAQAERLNNLADVLETRADTAAARADYAAARKDLREALDIQVRLHGPKHWKTTDVRVKLAGVEHLIAWNPKQRRRFLEISQLDAQAWQLRGQGKYVEAAGYARRAIDLCKQLLGEDVPAYATRLNTLALIYDDAGRSADAEPLYRQALKIRAKALGEEHPDYAISLNNLALLSYRQGRYADAEPLYRKTVDVLRATVGAGDDDYETCAINLATLYRAQGKSAQTAAVIQQLLDSRKALGPESAAYAASLHDAGNLYLSQGVHFETLIYVRADDAARAERYFREALRIRKKVLGESNADYANTLHYLAVLYRMKGEYARAEPLFLEALRIRKAVLGEEHADYGNTLNSLAVLYRQKGDYVRAAQFGRLARDTWKKVLGPRHPTYALSLRNDGELYQDMGDDAQAESALNQALEVYAKVLQAGHPNYAGTLIDLAAVYRRRGAIIQAETLLQRAVQSTRRLGEDNPSRAACLHDLAELYLVAGRADRAEAPARQALRIRRKVVGETHPAYAASLETLGRVRLAQGNLAGAEELLHRAHELRKQVLGDDHPATARGLKSLAMVYDRLGQPDRAAALLRQSLGVARRNLQLASTVQSERQQLAMAQAYREWLDAYLSVAARARLSADEVYGPVLAWKGSVFARQRRLRLMRSAGDPETAQLFKDLQATTSYLTTLAFALPGTHEREDWRRQVRDLTEKKEGLERALAARDAGFRRQQATDERTPTQVRVALPKQVALVDVLEYSHVSPPAGGKGLPVEERRLAAFVIRRGGIERLDLGPVAPIAAAVDRWRTSFVRSADGRGRDPGLILRRLVWLRLEPALQGMETVLISPDGALARFPWAALPGKQPGAYLIEERGLAVVAVPQLLPELLAEDVPAGDVPNAQKSVPSLLLVGDVDFGAPPGRTGQVASRAAIPPVSRTAGLPTWPALPGTRGEILAIRDSFEQRYPDGRGRVLRGGQATKRAVMQETPNYRWLHVATHGFFAPAELRSALADPSPSASRGAAAGASGRPAVIGFHPGLLSGLALAGANRRAQPGEDDGILTALEVATLDLHRTDLAVLSACETGLGQAAGGEGLLGLQRAFQTAGARSVVASLWQVDDDATHKLMVRLYENLWEKKMTKLEALRQAQLWMLRDGAKRGLVVLDDQRSDKRSRLAPYYWAAFVLSGDWR